MRLSSQRRGENSMLFPGWKQVDVFTLSGPHIWGEPYGISIESIIITIMRDMAGLIGRLMTEGMAWSGDRGVVRKFDEACVRNYRSIDHFMLILTKRILVLTHKTCLCSWDCPLSLKQSAKQPRIPSQFLIRLILNPAYTELSSTCSTPIATLSSKCFPVTSPGISNTSP